MVLLMEGKRRRRRKRLRTRSLDELGISETELLRLFPDAKYVASKSAYRIRRTLVTLSPFSLSDDIDDAGATGDLCA